MIECLCNLQDGEALCPCEAHYPQAYTTWLEENAPRLAAARAKNDPIHERNMMPTDAAEVPELARLRAMLSPAALEALDEEWNLNADSEQWPSAWEFALAARDNTEEIAAARERVAAREHLKGLIQAEEYPLAELEGSCYEPEIFTAEELLQEADALAEVAQRASVLEQLLRDHADGKRTKANEYLA